MFDLDWGGLRNPVWSLPEAHLRDPAVLVHEDRLWLFFTYYDPRRQTWRVGQSATRDFRHFEPIRMITPEGYASPGNVLRVGDEWILCHQQYREFPHYLSLSRSRNLRDWSAPEYLFNTGPENRWNLDGRVIDPFFVAWEGRYYCYYVGSTRWGKPSGHNLIGVAVSQDFVQWRDATPEAPAIGVDFDWEGPDGNENNCVVRADGRWVMLYSASLTRQQIAWAVSDDLIHWEKRGRCAVPPLPGTARKFGAPLVIEGLGPAEIRTMIYQGEDEAGQLAFFLARSENWSDWRGLPGDCAAAAWEGERA